MQLILITIRTLIMILSKGAHNVFHTRPQGEILATLLKIFPGKKEVIGVKDVMTMTSVDRLLGRVDGPKR